VQRSLPEMNEAKQKGKLSYPVYALHRGGEHEKAKKIIAGKDAKGRAWSLDFLWSTREFEKQLGGVKGLPSYYVLDSQARVRAMIKGHSKQTMATLQWLIDQLNAQDNPGVKKI
jgi:hypothetical protein